MNETNASAAVHPGRSPLGTGPVIRTRRFMLEPLKTEHAALVSEWLAAERIIAGVGGAEGATADAVRRRLDRAARDGRLTIGIRPLDRSDPIGVYTLDVDRRNGTAAIALVIGEETSLRQAIGIETARALMDWAFQVARIHKVTARVLESNAAAAGWLTSRLTPEGRLREQVLLPDGGRSDVLLFGVLRSEWESLRRLSVSREADRQSGGGID